jgi:phage terminase small subunit
MARPRTPTAVLELRGSFKTHPSRKRPDEPRPTGKLGDPPPHLGEAALAAWHEIVGMAPPGVLTSADRWAVEIAAGLMAQFRAGDLLPAGVGHLRGILGRMGLTPADRAGLNIPQPKPTGSDKWAQFRRDT